MGRFCHSIETISFLLKRMMPKLAEIHEDVLIQYCILYRLHLVTGNQVCILLKRVKMCDRPCVASIDISKVNQLLAASITRTHDDEEHNIETIVSHFVKHPHTRVSCFEE